MLVLKNYYFTFGSAWDFPYQNTYLMVVARTLDEACKTFRGHYPDRTEGVLNCSDYYWQSKWDDIAKIYYPEPPVEIIWAEEIPLTKGYDDLYVYVPSKKEIIWAHNVIEDQHTNDVSWTVYRLDSGMDYKNTGHILKGIEDKDGCITKMIPDMLVEIYGNCNLEFAILN